VTSSTKRMPRLGRLAVVFGMVAGLAVFSSTPATATITQNFTGSVTAGGTAWKQHLFDVVDDGQIQATLDWTDASANLNLFLHRKNADGTWTQMATATSTTKKPEQITFAAGTVGTWRVGIRAVSGSSAYTVNVTHSPDASPPPASLATYSETFGYGGPAGNYAYGGDWDPSTNTMLWGDYWNYRVKRFTIDGQKCTPALCNGSPHVVTTVKAAGLLGGSTAPYDVETDMSDLDGSGRASFWVADQGSSRIVEYSNTGQWLQTIGLGGGGTGAGHPGHSYPVGCGAGKTTIPTHMWVDPANGRLYVGDPRCRNVYVFTHDGGFLFEFGWSGWKTLTGLGTPVPRGLAEGRDFDGNGQRDIYVVEHNSRRVVVFNKAGQFLGAFPRVDEMNDPRGLDVDPVSGRVVTVSAIKNRVYVFSPQGALVQKWGDMDGPTSSAMGNRLFDSIRFPAVDGDGNIYTGDTWGFREPDPRTGSTWFGYRVYKFSPTFDPMPWATGPEPPPDGGYNQNNGIGVSPAGALFVVDTFQQRVQKFNSGGTCTSVANCPAWMLQFAGRAGAGLNSEGVGYPRALTFGSDGRVWIGDNNNDVQAWTPGGGSTGQPAQFVHRFGTQGHGPGQFVGGVQGLRVVHNRVYATDFSGGRLQVFDLPRLLQVSSGTSALQALVGGLSLPRGVAADPNNAAVAYVVEFGGNRIARVNLNLGAAGSPGGGTVTRITACGLRQPWGITERNGSYYIGDVGNKRIMKYTPATGACVPVITGLPQGSNYVEFDSAGRLFASDNSKRILVYSGVS